MHNTTRIFPPYLGPFPRTFQDEDRLGPQKSRHRRFEPGNLFLTMVELVAGTNGEGYLHALAATFFHQPGNSPPPTKSAFCRARQKVKYQFFERQLSLLLSRFEAHRYRWRGLRLYAIDGCELTLPCTENILGAGYRGRVLTDGRETYYPRLYLVHAFDVLSGVTKGLYFSYHRDELNGMRALVPHLEKRSLCLYDRLFLNHSLIAYHQQAGNFFLVRARKNCFGEVRAFFKSRSMKQSVTADGMRITLFKTKIPHSREFTVIATNLPKHLIRKRDVYQLYALRWEVENSFRDLACSIRITQWHSATINGILQEVFSAYWLMNYARIQIALRRKRPKNAIAMEYARPNFKLLLSYIVSQLTHPSTQSVFEAHFQWLLDHSTERRKHLSRHYPRAIRYTRRMYKKCNVVPRRTA